VTRSGGGVDNRIVNVLELLLDALEVVLALELWLLEAEVLEAEALVRLTVDETVTELLGRVPVPSYWNCGL
jgi:hypothetical protein